MLPMLHKHTMITAALVATLGLSACGKKKDLIEQPAPGQTSDQTVTQPNPTQKTDDTSGSIGGGLPDPNAQGDSDYNPPLPEPIPEPSKPTKPAPTPGKKPDAPKTQQPKPSTQVPPAPPAPGPVVSEPARPTTPPVVDTRPAPGGLTQLPPDYRTNDAANVTRDNLTKRMTGAVTEDGLVYTSSSTDNLLNYLRARNEKVSYETRRLNLDAAASVVSAKLSVDGLSGDAVVTLKVQEGGSQKVYNLAGANGSEGYASPLRSVRAGNGERSTGTRAIEGTLKCLDLDGGCETTFVRVKIGSSPASAIINLVFRNSAADLYFHLPAAGKHTDNPEFLLLQEFMLSTIQRLDVDNKVKTSKISSWEVVNGRSGFNVAMKGVNRELLAFAGPLLAPEAGTGVNINLSRIAKDQEDTLDLISLDNTRLNYANYIGEARLIANNGLGQVRIALKMRKRGAYAQDQFAVTFMRKIKPIVDLTDDNLK
ncbi:hypothetical protein [Bdellovibrio bacteriovorus]|uniref:hypothetical protein n=1 Tax=Bdellovibrio bacteriovorus TaxID=959 RepID=UPI0035A6DE3C